MKEKIIIFVIGLLVGAIIASGAFLVYTKISDTTCNTQPTEMNGGTPPEMPNGQPPEMPDRQNGENGQPPEMPNGQSPEKNNEKNTQSNSQKSNNE